ncbi:SulP family sulfate permease [Bradyrhizobium japonicum]|jgi:high affinity sulfate transporter 1|uniref:SulP family inorganic anion transporter n=1 Tax=Bradyrhizobium TaxID=374 RepID=UPI00041C119C|nr:MULTISPECIES: SulP family inorganic anion transporter [Bradyrhizobium]MBR0997776.1 SulP family inorganic anion transporter [Bradyrhizobium liaoningense]MBR1028171.1 SulP family inorganic anion transporter [Bradyrhizobium liaoningense]MBR1066291.1 SulP family inorganic anion transporter [Bradyrhizobium liaoningense]MCP1743642.1 high affinity sulfate transporter 1 [Bradyrhizobium japonicum]MCP1861355.1 high affinity sulfate transporter 1 [Bradyrhizobium japonicum]
MNSPPEASWMRFFPPFGWLAAYRREWLPSDAVAGITLAAYAIPVSLAYAALAGLPPQIGVYGYMLGGIGYALLGSSRQLAIGPTSAISLMIAATVGALAGGDAVRYAQIASLAAFAVAVLCFIAWLFKLSVLVRLVSDSILVGFKAGAGLTIIMSQLPSLLGVAGGGHNFFDRAIKLAGQLGTIDPLVLAVGAVALLLLLLGERLLPGKPVGITIVALAIVVATVLGLPSLGVPVTGKIPEGLPALAMPTFGLLEFDDLFPLAAGCVLLAYIEGVSAARSFAAKHGYPLDVRQEFLGLGAANLAAAFGHGYPVAGGLSQSAVNDSAGARTPLALVICSVTLGLCLLFFTGLLTNLPKAVLAAIVFAAVYKLVDVRALLRMWRISRIDFYAAAIALVSVLLLGILQGVLLAAIASIFLLLARASRPNVAFLGRLPGSGRYSDSARHEDVEPLAGIIAFRPEASLLYINAETILETVLIALRRSPGIRLVACDLSASPYIDLAGARMLHELYDELASREVIFCIVGAHAQLRDLLRAEGLAEKTDSGQWLRSLDSVLGDDPANTAQRTV